MATNKILKVVIHLMSLPHIVISRITDLLKLESLETDLCRCLDVANRCGTRVPLVLIRALIIAEDHRNLIHPGIDPIGILRAIVARVLRGEMQGASTIEQQFVRVVTGRYERTISRKIREQILALSLSRRKSKSEIASAYLSVAFFGAGCMGLKGLTKTFGSDLATVTDEQALKFMSQLKYPRPQAPSATWHKKIVYRTGMLAYRNRPTTNNAMQQTLVPRAADG